MRTNLVGICLASLIGLGSGLSAVAEPPTGSTAPAPIEVTFQDKAEDGFHVRLATTDSETRAVVWQQLLAWHAWWSDDHSWSGDAANFLLVATPGGCWCEKWGENFAVHSTVVGLSEQELLLLNGAFGPLREMGVSSSFKITLADAQIQDGASRTRLIFDLQISGRQAQRLDILAPVVAGVLQQQLARLVTLEGVPEER